MKALFLTTHTPDCEKTWRSLACLGHECIAQVYDDRPHDRHGELVDQARALAPHVIVYIGAIEQYHGRPVPSADVLCRLREIAPTVHICGDASDEPWWPLLEEFDRRNCFSAQVSIDGNPATPIARFENGLVKLTPTDPAAFEPGRPWDERNAAGMAGGLGHGERERLIARLRAAGLLSWMDSTTGATYAQMAAFLSGCKVVVNCPMNGSGNGDHVKGRVVEAGWAGACLLERENACTRAWFAPDELVEYSDPDDAVWTLGWLREHDALAQATAARFRAKVEAEHHPRVFWRDVFAKAGIAC